MNTDTLQEIMLNLSYNDVISMCSAYQLSNIACNDDFWKKKIELDYHIINGNKNEYKKLHHIEILVNQLLEVLKKLVTINKQVVVTMRLPDHANFYGKINEIYFTMYFDNNQLIYEINYLSDDEIEESFIHIKDLINLLIGLIYYHPNMIITEGLNDSPIIYNDLLTWKTTLWQDKRTKLLKLWKDILYN